MRLELKMALLGTAMMATSVPAFAGSYSECGATAYDCASDVWVSSTETVRDDVLVQIKQPYGHLKSVNYRSTPTVSITRLHDQGSVPGLEDFPGDFGSECLQGNRQYCGQGTAIGAVPPRAPLPAPVVSAPYAPVVHAPVHGALQPRGLRQWTASYDADPARFQPRQYGSLDFVPGVAHVPTSWVDRDPARAQGALNASGAGGIAPGPQTGLSRIPDNTPGPMIPITQRMGPGPVQPGSVVQPGPASHAPATPVNVLRIEAGAPTPAPLMPQYPHGVPGNYAAAPVLQAPMMQAPAMQAPIVQGPVLRGPVAQAPAPFAPGMGVSPSGVQLPNMAAAYPARPGAPLTAGDGIYASQVASDGTYWEKSGGTQLMGDTVVTQVICKRALGTEVVNPVIGVPQPVAVPVECASDMRTPHSAYSAHPAGYGPRATHGLAGGHF